MVTLAAECESPCKLILTIFYDAGLRISSSALPICGREKRAETRPENHPKPYAIRYARDGVAAEIAMAISPYDFVFLLPA